MFIIFLTPFINSQTEIKNLIDASRSGNIDDVKIILKQENININAQDKEGNTALIISSQNGHKEIVATLIAAKANLETKNTQGRNALMFATLNAHLDISKMLLAGGADVNSKDAGNDNALGWALESKDNENEKIIQLLIDAKVDIDNQGYYNKTPLLLACGYKKRKALAILLKAKANPDISDKDNNPPFVWAIVKNDLEIVKMLIAAKANVNKRCKDDTTPLIWAVQQGYTEIVKELIKAKADINIADNHNRTPIIWGAWGKEIKVLEELIQEKANINSVDNDKNNALFWALGNNHAEAAIALIKAKIDVNHKNNDSATALIWASSLNHVSVVKELIKANANIDSIDKNKKTALMFACEKGHIEVVKILLSNKAKINADQLRYSIIQLDGQVRLDIVTLLIANGADLTTSASNAIEAAVKSKDANLVTLLLNSNAHKNYQENDTRLINFTIAFGNLEILKQILKVTSQEHKNSAFSQIISLPNISQRMEKFDLFTATGVDIEYKDSFSGTNLLMDACFLGRKAIVQKLIELNVNLNKKNKEGKTALVISALQEKMDCFRMLLKANAAITKEVIDSKQKNIKEIHKIIKEERDFYISLEKQKVKKVEVKVKTQRSWFSEFSHAWKEREIIRKKRLEDKERKE